MSNSYQSILAHYEPRFAPGRESYDMLDWATREAQTVRFQVLARVLGKTWPDADEASAPRLLDAGCGFAELKNFLDQKKLPVRYVGVDLSGKFLATAKGRDPRLDLAVGDVFHRAIFPAATFDCVYSSGALNLRTPQHDYLVAAALVSMFNLSRRLLVFNMLHSRTVRKYDHCHYYHPGEAISLLPAAAQRKVELIDNYLENDFTLVVEKCLNP